MQGTSPDEDDINHMCLQLFDGWCERRSVVPLAYLMHVWPLLNSGRLLRGRLQATLMELQRFHPELLTQTDHLRIRRVLSIEEKGADGAPDDALPAP